MQKQSAKQKKKKKAKRSKNIDIKKATRNLVRPGIPEAF